jgi:hypothetical protein
MRAGLNAGFLSAESEFARHAAFAERKATIGHILQSLESYSLVGQVSKTVKYRRISSHIETLLGTCPTSAKRSGSSSMGYANACPPFSHGIVAFNGWPLNALRGDNH